MVSVAVRLKYESNDQNFVEILTNQTKDKMETTKQLILQVSLAYISL